MEETKKPRQNRLHRVDYSKQEWIEKMPGIFIKEAQLSPHVSLDQGRFWARYPMHRNLRSEMLLQVTDGACEIEFRRRPTLQLTPGQVVAIPVFTDFAIQPIVWLGHHDRFVEMNIVCAPAWRLEDVVFC